MRLNWNRKTNEENLPADKETVIRAMGGNSGSLESAVSSAPDSTDSPVSPTAVKPSRTRKARIPSGMEPQASNISPQTISEIEKQEKRRQALQKMSEMMLQDMAGAPYEFWAAVVDDEDMKLTKEEAEELGEAYRIVAESLPMGNMPAWITMPLFILGRNSKLVRKRMKLMAENQEKKLIAEAEKQKLPV